jgi:hypothetical protein
MLCFCLQRIMHRQRAAAQEKQEMKRNRDRKRRSRSKEKRRKGNEDFPVFPRSPSSESSSSDGSSVSGLRKALGAIPNLSQTTVESKSKETEEGKGVEQPTADSLDKPTFVSAAQRRTAKIHQEIEATFRDEPMEVDSTATVREVAANGNQTDLTTTPKGFVVGDVMSGQTTGPQIGKESTTTLRGVAVRNVISGQITGPQMEIERTAISREIARGDFVFGQTADIQVGNNGDTNSDQRNILAEDQELYYIPDWNRYPRMRANRRKREAAFHDRVETNSTLTNQGFTLPRDEITGFDDTPLQVAAFYKEQQAKLPDGWRLADFENSVGGRATLFYITKVAQAQKDGTDLRLHVPLRKDFPPGPDGEAEFSRTKKRIIRGQPPMEFTESDFDETSGNESLFTALATESMKLAVHDLHTGLSDFEDSPEEENKEQKKPEIDGAVTEARKVTKKREKKKRTKSDRPPKPEKWADMSKGDYEKYIARPISQNEWAQTRHNWATNEKVEGEIRLTAGAAAARILSGAEATQMRLPLESTSEQMSRKDYEKYIRRMVPEGEWLEIQKLWTTGPLEELDRTIEHPTLTIREVAVIRRGPLKDGYLPRLPASTRRELGDNDWSSIFKQYFMTCRSFGSMLFNRQKFEFYLGANISDYIFALFWNTYAETPEYHHFSKRLHPDGRLIRLKELVDETQMVKPQCKVEYQDVVGRWVTNDEYQLAMVQLHIEAQAFPLNNVPIIDQTERRMRFETLIGHRTRDSQWDYTRAHGERNTYLGTQIGDEISKFDDDNWARAREEGRERMRQQRNWPPNPDLVDTSLQPTYLLQQDAYQLAAILQEITAIEFEKGYEDAPFRTSNKEKGPTPTELEWVLFRKLAPEEYQILYLRPEQRRLNEQTITELDEE